MSNLSKDGCWDKIHNSASVVMDYSIPEGYKIFKENNTYHQSYIHAVTVQYTEM